MPIKGEGGKAKGLPCCSAAGELKTENREPKIQIWLTADG
jgi:hypothetical protein